MSDIKWKWALIYRGKLLIMQILTKMFCGNSLSGVY